jgi:hypothetical protein
MIERYFGLTENHPWMFVLLTAMALMAWCQIVYAIFTIVKLLLFDLPNRLIRSKNICKNGWPPSHCDADGDTLSR